MPPSDIHESKKKKNWAVFAAVVGFMALIWVITMVRIANASEFDIDNAFPESRIAHQERVMQRFENFEPLRIKGQKRTATNDEGAFFNSRMCHMYDIYKVKDKARRKEHKCDI